MEAPLNDIAKTYHHLVMHLLTAHASEWRWRLCNRLITLIKVGRITCYLPEPSRRLGHKMQSISVVFSTLHCEGYFADLRYRWLITSGSARWLAGSLKLLSAILKSTRHGGQSTERCVAFWGTTRPPAFTTHKFMSENMSEYLERQFYERLRKSEPSIEKLIENIKNVH